MDARKLYTGSALAVLVTVLLLWSFGALAWGYLRPILAPHRDFAIDGLFPDVAPFPPGTIRYVSSLRSDGQGDIGARGAEYSWPGGGAVLDIYRYSSRGQAYRLFHSPASLRAEYGNPEAGYEPWAPPPEVPYKSSVATGYRLLCAKRVGPYMDAVALCTLTASYEEYFVIMHARVDTKRLTYERLEEVLAALDGQMSEHLYPGR